MKLSSIRRWILLCCITVFQATMIFSQEYLAVLQLDPQGLSEVEASILTDRLRSELFQTGQFEVIEREKMNQILDEQNFQLSGCTSNECMVEIGQLIGVQQIIGGTVSKFGTLFSISIRLIDVATGRILETAIYDHRGEIEGLLDTGTANVARQMAFPDETAVVTSNTENPVEVTEPQQQPTPAPEATPTTQPQQPAPQRRERVNEGWYSYWAFGGANFTYPDELQASIDALESLPDVNRTKIALDILGFYFPISRTTILGFIVKGGGDRFDLLGESVSIFQYMYSLSTIHFMGSRVGRGFFLRGDIGAANIAIEDPSGELTRSKSGLGLLLGTGWSLDLGNTQFLLGTNAMLRNVEDNTYTTVDFTLGILL